MHFRLVWDDNQVHVLHRRFLDIVLQCNWTGYEANKPQLEVCVSACVCVCVCVSGGVTTLCHLCALSHWSDGRWEKKKVTFPDIICHEQSRTHMAKSERPSMPIIEYTSFAFDEASDALQTQHVRTLLQFHKLAGIVLSSGITENFITYLLASTSSLNASAWMTSLYRPNTDQCLCPNMVFFSDYYYL